MKVAVVDVDDTILIGGRLSRLCWKLSKILQEARKTVPARRPVCRREIDVI